MISRPTVETLLRVRLRCFSRVQHLLKPQYFVASLICYPRFSSIERWVSGSVRQLRTKIDVH
jgi:hypothetical protein